MSDGENHSVHLESFEDNDENCQDDENDDLPKHGDLVPKIGMKFNDENEIFEFYKRYAYQVGFPVRKRNSKKGEDGVVNYVVYACSREGKRSSQGSTSLKPQPTIRVGCKAKISAALVVLGTWRVCTVHLEHNHETSPSKSRLYKCNRQLTEHVKRQLEVNDMAGISLHKSYNSTVIEAGGYDNMTFVEKDCRNYIDKVRRLRLGEGDAAAIQAYFSKMQAFCPGFYFNIDYDEECRLRNVFWADNRCRQAYKEFGDVITFDTTYLTNRYEMPFAPFVGVNHHGQSTLFGCGLLSSEDTRTFVWLFRTWLECMEYHAPARIITDQDKAMRNAIEMVFPHTKHRWCLWHILRKLPEKFGSHRCKDLIFSAIHDAVYESQTVEEFEEGWMSMIDKYTLHDNNWLSSLYIERARWVPCFLKTSFWAGMSTTQRSESINAFFDGYVHSKTSLKQFVEQYERALRSRVEKEFQADAKSFSHMVPCVSIYPIEKQFQKVYTIAKFKEFQEEFTGKMCCEVVSTEEGSLSSRYVVREDIIINGRMKERKYSVILEEEECAFVCSCHMFEFKGIVCRHAITVLIRNGIRLIPERYILRRWRKDVSRAYMKVKINYNGWICTPSQLRYDKLLGVFTKIANVASEDEACTEATIEWAESKFNALSILDVRQSCGSNINAEHTVEDEVSYRGEAAIVASAQILDPKCSQTKGAPRKLRKKGPLETSSKKAKVRTSKSNPGNTSRHNMVEGSQILNEGTLQLAQYHDSTALSYSQQLMATHHQSWNAFHGMHFMPSYDGTTQPFMPMFASHPQPDDNPPDY